MNYYNHFMKWLLFLFSILQKKMVKMLTFKPISQIGLTQDFLLQFLKMNTNLLLKKPYVNGVKLSEENLS